MYVYRHIRLDKNEVFYIGIGSDTKYKRAKTKRNRNKSWQSIVGRTEYVVEIMLDNLSYEEANEKEIEFISYYKRKCDGGTLVNLTLGGGGAKGVRIFGRTPPNKGVSISEEQKRIISERNKGLPAWNKGKKMTEAYCKRNSESKKGRKAWNKGMKMSKEYIDKYVVPRQEKPVFQYTVDGRTLLNEFTSAKEAVRELGFKLEPIRQAARGQYSRRYTNIYRGFRWEQKKLPLGSLS